MDHNRTKPSLNVNRSEKPIVVLLARQDSFQVLSMWQNDRISEYLLASDSRRHIWHAWLAVHGTAVRDVAETYGFLTFAKSRQILGDAFGSCPSGMISALGKFGPYARSKHAYFALHKVLSAGGPLANHVCQSARFEDDDLIALASASMLPVSTRVVCELLKCRMPSQVMVELLWVIARLVTTHDEHKLVRCIAEGRQPAMILANLLGLTAFPAPPFEQVGKLVPITAAEQLRNVGRDFRNCLKDGEQLAFAVVSAQSGHRYFYLWTGESPALLSFNKCGNVGWVLSEREGVANSPVSQATLDEIAETLAGLPNVFIGKRQGGLLEWMATG